MNNENNTNLIAPCGINCAVCIAYLRDKNPCPGCRADDAGKSKARLTCKMKTCPEIEGKGNEYCYQCGEFPCKRLGKLDERYRKSYHMSLVENLEEIRDSGLENFLEKEKERWTCTRCGGTISVHRGYCHDCGKVYWRLKKMTKEDLKKEEKEFYTAPKKDPVIVEVPEMRFLMIDGKGDPNTSKEYQEAMETLFPVSFKAKFISKREKSKDYVVMPLEGLWWVDNMEDFTVEDKSGWKWTAMIRQPDFISQRMIKDAILEVEEKKNPPAISKIRFVKFQEGLSAQIMHIGPYSEEGPTVEKLHNFIHEKGYQFNGSKPGERHHEIYLSDVRRSKPERLKTIIRQPIR